VTKQHVHHIKNYLLEKYLWQDAAKNVSGHTPVWKLHQHNPENIFMKYTNK
jgi:hypothetical protein